MEKTTLSVPGISCEHCERAITNAVKVIKGIKTVSVNIKGKTVSVEYDPNIVALDLVKKAIVEEGYEIE
jgi:copper chaperone